MLYWPRWGWPIRESTKRSQYLFAGQLGGGKIGEGRPEVTFYEAICSGIWADTHTWGGWGDGYADNWPYTVKNGKRWFNSPIVGGVSLANFLEYTVGKFLVWYHTQQLLQLLRDRRDKFEARTCPHKLRSSPITGVHFPGCHDVERFVAEIINW